MMDPFEVAGLIRAIESFCRGLRLNRRFRAANGSRLDIFDVGEETITAPGDGFHKAGTLGGVAEGLADFVDRFVEPVIEIHESVCGPKPLLKILASHELAGVRQQHPENSEGLFLKPNS